MEDALVVLLTFQFKFSGILEAAAAERPDAGLAIPMAIMQSTPPDWPSCCRFSPPLWSAGLCSRVE